MALLVQLALHQAFVFRGRSRGVLLKYAGKIGRRGEIQRRRDLGDGALLHHDHALGMGDFAPEDIIKRRNAIVAGKLFLEIWNGAFPDRNQSGQTYRCILSL